MDMTSDKADEKPGMEPVAMMQDLAGRKSALALLARAKTDELAGPLGNGWPTLEIRDLKKPETGLAMVRGRTGGDGAAFNLGEATVTRAVVELPNGLRGFGHVLGRRPRMARMVAIADALWQDGAARARIENDILAPIAMRLGLERAEGMARTAATKVDFFTLVRGEAE